MKRSLLHLATPLLLMASLTGIAVADSSGKPEAARRCALPGARLLARIAVEERDADTFNDKAVADALTALQLTRIAVPRGDLDGSAQTKPRADDGTFFVGTRRYVITDDHKASSKSPHGVVFATDASGAIFLVEVAFHEVAPPKTYFLCGCGRTANRYTQAAEIPAGRVYQGLVHASAQHRKVGVSWANLRRDGETCLQRPPESIWMMRPPAR